MRWLLGTICALAVIAGACGEPDSAASKRTPARPTALGTAGTGSGTAIASTAVVSGTAITTPSAGGTPAVPTSGPAQPTSTPPRAGETGIYGTVTIGPTCPVERADSPCPDRPYQARITISRDGTPFAETMSGADGHFFVPLPAGTYLVRGESAGALPRGSEETVTVVAGAVASVALRFDSGIR